MCTCFVVQGISDILETYFRTVIITIHVFVASLRKFDTIDRIPSLALCSLDTDSSVSFRSVSKGHTERVLKLKFSTLMRCGRNIHVDERNILDIRLFNVVLAHGIVLIIILRGTPWLPVADRSVFCETRKITSFQQCVK